MLLVTEICWEILEVFGRLNCESVMCNIRMWICVRYRGLTGGSLQWGVDDGGEAAMHIGLL